MTKLEQARKIQSEWNMTPDATKEVTLKAINEIHELSLEATDLGESWAISGCATVMLDIAEMQGWLTFDRTGGVKLGGDSTGDTQ